MFPFNEGDVYEDCSYHPVLCTNVDYDGDDLTGISLFDGSRPRSCSIRYCAPRKLTIEEVAFKIQNRERWLAAESAWRDMWGASNMSMNLLNADNPYDELLTEEEERFGVRNV